jgi:DNA-binding NarL/FixJ family response regulator
MQTTLTGTEVVIADLAVRGKKTDEIAGELDMSPAAVARSLARIYCKLGLAGRTDLEGPTSEGRSDG